MAGLRTWLQESSIDAYLQHGSSENADLFYTVGFTTSDAVEAATLGSGTVLFVSSMERSRAIKESTADEVKTGNFEDMKEMLKDEKVSKVAVPEEYPSGLLKELERSFDVEVRKSPLTEERMVKSEQEIEKIISAQKATENAMKHAKSVIKDSDIEGDELVWKDEKLTSERLKQEIQKHLLEANCQNVMEPITSSGSGSADPHVLGSGPIKKDEPVVIDIFPRKEMYFGDMTRTFLKEDNEDIEEMHEAVKEAKRNGLDEIKAGVAASKVHRTVVRTLEEHGFETTESEGFIHSTGHGVGLDLHEGPRIAEDSEHELEAGEILTIEPGLYYRDKGGVRIEDMVLVTEDGYENLNSMSEELKTS
ncbi:MAG: M24 family metallopeptidase [Candidatus Nanohaloarchaea archaeon]